MPLGCEITNILATFQNKDILVQLDELDELDKTICVCNLKLTTSTVDSLV